jgi:hypothetical protein
MEHYAGIEVSLELSSVCVVDAKGKIVKRRRSRANLTFLFPVVGPLGGSYLQIGGVPKSFATHGRTIKK